jgi:hypothetical protein
VAPPEDPSAKLLAEADRAEKTALSFGNNKHLAGTAGMLIKRAEALRTLAKEMRPKNAGTPYNIEGPDGETITMQGKEFGPPEVLRGYTLPTENVYSSAGNRIVALPKTGRVPMGTSLEFGQSPDSVATQQSSAADRAQRAAFDAGVNPVEQSGIDAQRATTANQEGQLGVAQGHLSVAQADEARKAAEAKLGKPLSGEAAKVNAIATTMLPELRALRQAYVDQGVAASRGISRGNNRELVDLVASISDKIGRLRSGGAIGEVEADRFMSQIHHWTNSLPFSGPQASIKGIDRFLEEAKLVQEGVDPTGKHGGTAPEKKKTSTEIYLESLGKKK